MKKADYLQKWGFSGTYFIEDIKISEKALIEVQKFITLFPKIEKHLYFWGNSNHTLQLSTWVIEQVFDRIRRRATLINIPTYVRTVLSHQAEESETDYNRYTADLWVLSEIGLSKYSPQQTAALYSLIAEPLITNIIPMIITSGNTPTLVDTNISKPLMDLVLGNSSVIEVK